MKERDQGGKRHVRKTAASNRARQLWYGIAGGVIVVGLAVVVFQYARDRSRAPHADGQSGGTSNPPSTPASRQASSQASAIPAPTYPRIPAGITVPPNWLIADSPFDLKKLFAPIPPAENAAQLYLEALMEFSGELAGCFPEKEREALMTATRQRVSRFTPEYELWSAGNRVNPADIDQAVAAFQVGFEKLARAQERPRCQFETGVDLTALLPHVQAVRQVANVVQLRNARDLERGDVRRPIQALEMLLRLTRDMQARSVIICSLVGAAIEKKALAMVRDILRAPTITREGVDQLRAVLARHEQASPAYPLEEPCMIEYVMNRITFRDIEQHTGSFSPAEVEKSAKNMGASHPSIGGVLAAISGNNHSAQQLDAQLALLTSDDYRKLDAAINEHYRGLADIWGRPYVERAVALREATAQAHKQALLAVLVVNLDKIDLAVTTSQAARRAALCLAALRRWQLENVGTLPDLATIVKAAGIDAVPTDPFSGKPMLLTSVRGEPVVYSVGKDGRDDKALRDWDNGKQDGDFIFRLSDKSR